MANGKCLVWQILNDRLMLRQQLETGAGPISKAHHPQQRFPCFCVPLHALLDSPSLSLPWTVRETKAQLHL